jgi:hypothetical protein
MTMTVYDFLNKLNQYYPSKEKDEVFKQKLNDYADCILEYAHKCRQEFDYDKVFKKFMLSYRFKVFPSMPDILDVMPYGAITPEVKFTGKEGDVIKRIWQGHEYEFVVVPNSWDNVMTISELDRDIARRNANGNTGAESF